MRISLDTPANYIKVGNAVEMLELYAVWNAGHLTQEKLDTLFEFGKWLSNQIIRSEKMTNREKAQQLIQEYGERTDFHNYTDAVEWAAKEMGLSTKVIMSMILMGLWRQAY